MTTSAQIREKRPRVYRTPEECLGDAQFDEIWTQYISEEVFDQTSLFDIAPSAPLETICDLTTRTLATSRKRSHRNNDTVRRSPSTFCSVELRTTSEDLQDLFPELRCQLPSLDDRPAFRPYANPYLENHAAITERHPCLKASRFSANVINGYLKFAMGFKDQEYSGEVARSAMDISNNVPLLSGITSPQRVTASTARHAMLPGQIQALHHHKAENVSRLPSGFGSNAKIDTIDRKILRFYTVAVCGGRTLLKRTNAWLDLASVIDGDECARHAALAFSAGYLLDYIPSEKFRVRANFHYKRANELLNLALNDRAIYDFGKEDGIVTALHLLWSEDIVQWELRRPKHVRPRWRCGTQTAKAILDDTDPGYRYWHRENVQTTSVRRSNANMCAYAEICALPVTKLCIVDFDKLYPWLLGGTEEEVREIHGGTGVCPKILHIYAQITQLAARVMEDPESPILPHWADAIMSQLTDFRQTSELSIGYDSTDALLNACLLDEHGLVQCATKVTELTAETWVQAAQIYLCCRFYRMPRDHPKVLSSLSKLLRCVERMPTKGPLFTAQSPFFCIFMAGLVAYRDEDRLVLRRWFEVIVSSASGRSSVPPIYKALENFWPWIDSQPYALVDEHSASGTSLNECVPWWEHMVEWFLENYGELSLV